MADSWQTLPLEDCMAALIDYRGKTPEKTPTGVPLVTAKVIKGGRIEKPNEFIAETDFISWMRRGMPQPGDVVMTTEAPLGEVAQLDGRKVALAQRVITLRGKPDILDNTFLKFLLQSNDVQEELRSRATGTTVLGIRQSELRKVSLTIPPLAVQKAIAHILGSIDDKIEMNRRMNETLEGMAQALFQSWFVNFDPVRVKLDGKPPAGMDAETAALFPSEFQGSPLGPIPKEWCVKRIDEVAERIAMGPFGSNITRDNFVDHGVPVVRGCNLTRGFIEDDFVYLTDQKAAELRNSIAYRGDLVFTHRGTLGQVGLIPDDSLYPEYVVSQSQMLLRLKRNEISAEMVYQFFLSVIGQQALLANTSQTGVPAIAQPTSSLKSIQLIVPHPRVSTAFTNFMKPIRRQCSTNVKQTRTLAALRDTLLPKLLSGEVRVEAAERELAEAATCKDRLHVRREGNREHSA